MMRNVHSDQVPIHSPRYSSGLYLQHKGGSQVAPSSGTFKVKWKVESVAKFSSPAEILGRLLLPSGYIRPLFPYLSSGFEVSLHLKYCTVKSHHANGLHGLVEQIVA